MARLRVPALLTVTFALAACSRAPDYEVPATPGAAQYHTVGAQPADQLNRAGWWRMYNDAQLDDLETRLLANNTDLKAAFAPNRQAHAFVDQVSAGLFRRSVRTLSRNATGSRTGGPCVWVASTMTTPPRSAAGSITTSTYGAACVIRW